MELDSTLLLPAFIAGLLTFLAPCTFPLLPAYLTIIAGGPLEQDQENKRFRINWKIVVNGLAYVLGFTLIFITLGLFAGFIGNLIPGFKGIFSRIGGVLVIFFGLYLLGVFSFSSLDTTKKLGFASKIRPGTPIGSFSLGITMAFGWTPCVGPILGGILVLAANSGTAIQGAVLLLVFSLGLGLPFMFFAFAIGLVSGFVKRMAKYTPLISKISGALLLVIGLLLLFDRFEIFIKYGFMIFEFLGYDQILQYL
jgi:cytochrome c-type biogenesis protein